MGHDGDIIGMGIVVWVDDRRGARVRGLDVDGAEREGIRQAREKHKHRAW